MRTADDIQRLVEQYKAEGMPSAEIIQRIAPECIGWPYVYGAWGELCTPEGRKRRMSEKYPTIKSSCQCLRDKDRMDTCAGCKWYPGGNRVRMFDCRGFTDWLLKLVGIDLQGEGATSQWNNTANWAQRGEISQMPEDLVCCVFRRRKSDGAMEHTGMHIGGSREVECAHNVEEGTTTKGWTHYGIPAGLYSELPKQKEHRTLRKGAQGDDVREMQELLQKWGINVGNIDGIFGKQTEAAVKGFQKAQGLTVDGVCGPATWAALEQPVATYTVTVEGATWAQFKLIREVCPLAMATKEAEP